MITISTAIKATLLATTVSAVAVTGVAVKDTISNLSVFSPAAPAPYTVACESDAPVCHVRLSMTISGPEGYRELLHIFDTAPADAIINLHLIGNGGRVSTVLQLVEVIKNAPQKVITTVEGNVYSGHAFLALVGDEIVIRDNVLFLFHSSSLRGNIESSCDGEEGKTDRGQDAQAKCYDLLNKMMISSDKALRELTSGVLTDEEIEQMEAGHDLVITGEEIRRRLEG